MHLLFLGTGGSWPSKFRNVSSTALKLDGEIILFDCGEGTQRQLMRSNLSFMKIEKIFISHFHGDHFLGLPGLIQSMSLNERKTKLEIFGPKYTSMIISNLMRLGYFSPTFKLSLHDLKDGGVVRGKNYRIYAKRVKHHVPTLGYRFEENKKKGRFDLGKAKKLGIPRGPLYRKLQNGETVKIKGKTIKSEDVLGPDRMGRKIVYANDTRPCEPVIGLAKNCDVLIHDATLDSSLEEKAKKFGHSTAKQAAEIAKRANAKKLFLVHISPRYEDAIVLENEAKSIFPNTTIAEDFMEYKIK